MEYQPYFTDFELKVLRTALHYFEAETMDSKNDMRFIDDNEITKEHILEISCILSFAVHKREQQRREKKGVAV
jgi:hypothetical protein